MRLFIAIDLNEEVRGNIKAVQRKLGHEGLKLVEPENLHLTLKFLGEVPESDLHKIESSISDSVKGLNEFKLSFHGVGYFGSERFMKVIWAGVDSGKEQFISLARSLEERLSFVRKEEREPSPHLTIARVNSTSPKLAHEIASLKGVKLGEIRVKEISLKKSVLTPQGPIYSDVKAFPLK